ncbi:hypothetical protein [uncultured Phenylobacterium sp.]|uniref:hypothetical protein n=1 Tax=uncultured Phenylobacterium sp. TaxID=349273 RepID=UPI0025D2E180|nr:hypothetical protein [uncultured Phenylobacterium sp.]
MDSSPPAGEGDRNVDETAQVRELKLGGVPSNTRVVKLRELGFVGYVSDEARQEIEQSEVRAGLVLTTAAQFAFR